ARTPDRDPRRTRGTRGHTPIRSSDEIGISTPMQAQPGCRKPTPALKSPHTPAAPTHNAHPTRRDGHPTTDHTLRRSRSRQPTKVHLACEQRHTPSSPVTKPPRPWRHRFPTPPAPRRNGINPGDVAAP